MFRLSPSFIIVVSFILVILAGAMLLSLPIASANGAPTNFLDAFFTANSAVTVTGLVTLDTGTYFSLFGLIVIVLLIQVGGLAMMTLSTFMLLVFRQQLFFSQKHTFKESLNLYSAHDVIHVFSRIVGIVLIIEAVGALVLFLRWLPEMGIAKACLYAIFHAVSAFNNAGFSLPAHFASLLPYASDGIINLTITTLVIIGGIGFVVIADLMQRRRLSLHSKVVIITTLLLIIASTLLFFSLERHNPETLGKMTLSHKIMASYFQAVAPRTAGFHTIDLGKIFPATALFTMLLMFIGASPSGTGGGVKTTTFAIILSTIWATLKGFKNTIIYNRRLPAESVRQAFAVTFLSLTVIAVAIFSLGETEKAGIMPIAFETFSAFGNVGFSLGLTPYLSSLGKIIIIAVMLLGRIGPLALLLSLNMGRQEPKIEPPKEGISIT
jgi:trk system potassium uptake protein